MITPIVFIAADVSLERPWTGLGIGWATISVAIGYVIREIITYFSKRKRAAQRVKKFNRWSDQTLLQTKRDGIYLWHDGNPEMLPWPMFSHHKFDEDRLYLLMDDGDAFVIPVAVIGGENIDQTRNWLLESNVDEIR